MVAEPDAQTRSSLIPKVLVIAALAFLAAVAGAAPFVVPPTGISTDIDLEDFQIMLAAAAGLLALILLLATSATGIFWPEFLHPAHAGRDALRSLQWAGWSLGMVIALFISMVAIGFVGFATDTATPPVWVSVQNWLRGLIMVAAVAGSVCLARSCILLVRMLIRGDAR
jgi:hypothetical protein